MRHLETVVAEKDDELKVLHRRLQLDTKGFKQQINSGIIKQKELMLKLDKANAEILRIGEIIRTEVCYSIREVNPLKFPTNFRNFPFPVDH